ncbi:MAG: L,D-transpeptidase family protein [Kiritimatiellia bacterium]
MVQLQDFNDPPPSRMPWIILILVVLVLSVVGWRFLKKAAPPAPPPALVEKVAPPAPPVVVPAPPTNVVPAAVMEAAAALEKEGKLVEARESYLEILDANPGLPAVEQKAAALSMELILKPHPMPEKTNYVVAAGDTLDKIARKFGTTKELLVTNNLIAKASLIKRGDHYRVFTGTFKVRVNKSRKELLLTLNGRFFKRYRIGTGKFGKTPAGDFIVTERVSQPVWWKADGKAVPFGHPENILGTHWLALRAAGATPPVSGYGIHGTWDDSSIGKDESAGCVRMRNADVEELYVLMPVGTEVVIEE